MQELDKIYELHAEQYKMLREEIIFHVKETRKLEIYAVTAIYGLYAWLIANNGDVFSFFLATPIPILGAMRSNVSLKRIKEIAAYQRKLECFLFSTYPTEIKIPPGWENYFNSIETKSSLTNIAKGFWIIVIASTIVCPFLFGK